MKTVRFVRGMPAWVWVTPAMVLGILCVGGSEVSSAAEREKGRAARSAQQEPSAADEMAAMGKQLTRIEKKLDDLLAQQPVIQQRFDALMDELRVIKVRATLHS